MSAFGGKADIHEMSVEYSRAVQREPSNVAVAEGVILQTKFSPRTPRVVARMPANLGVWLEANNLRS
jgi:hypothetical protein